MRTAPIEEVPTHSVPFWKTTLRLASQTLMALAAMGLLASGFARWSYFCDLVTHFRFQYTAVFLISGSVLLFLRPRYGVIALSVGIVLLALLLPYLPRELPAEDGEPTRLVVMNVWTMNRQHQDVIDFLRRQNADVIALVEITDKWLMALDPALSDYTYQNARSPGEYLGVAVYSRLPILSTRVIRTEAQLPSLDVELERGAQRPLRLLVTHPLPPVNDRHWRLRNAHFRTLSELIVDQADRPFSLVAGDLNCSPWSPYFKRFLSESGLSDSSIGHGLWPTWYALPTILASIPIDHVLVGPQIRVLRRSVGPDLGSDHRAVTLDFDVR